MRPYTVKLVPLLTTLLFAAPAFASFHLVDINEVFTSADGSVQYVELRARSAGQTNLSPTRIDAFNADGTVTTIVFDFTASFTWGSGDTLLVATPAFQAATGFAPDFVMAAGSLITQTSGRIEFDQDSQTSVVDAVAYGSFTGNNGSYGSPAAALPSDGCTALSRIAGQEANDNNAASFETVAGTPRRQDGTTTTLTCPPPVPATDEAGRLLMVLLMATTAVLSLAWLRRGARAEA